MSGIQEQTLAAMVASLAARMPGRTVQRSLPKDPAGLQVADLVPGLVCIVAAGGGSFANWSGREGELGSMNVKVVAFLAVDEDTEPQAIEQAENALLADLLAWCQDIKPEPLDDVVPGNYQQSSQVEHPYGWLVLDLTVRNV
ncbi:hypothetical protein [Rhodoferax sp. WC2427]|uniref:hypothetical protein n=1 Tax=Rhodoferax sp. WC2427 TaxID=3234144 RepID=UPI0034671FDF